MQNEVRDKTQYLQLVKPGYEEDADILDINNNMDTIDAAYHALDTASSGARETEEEDVDLDIADESGNVIARFADGHIKTKKFDSEDLDDKAPKANPVFTGSISLGRKADTVVGNNSYAVGNNVEANGYCAHAEGNYTKAGWSAHAEGTGTQATGAASHAEGQSTIALGDHQHVFGKYNIEEIILEWVANTHYYVGDKVIYVEGTPPYAIAYVMVCDVENTDTSFVSAHWHEDVDQNITSKYVEIVGNGTSASNRSNARSLDWEGNERLAGDIYVNCDDDSSDGTPLGETVSAVQEEIEGLPSTRPTNETNVDLDMTDINGNVIARFSRGHIATKKFNSQETPSIEPTTASGSDLDITDAAGNVIMRLQNGHIYTKRFDSSNIGDGGIVVPEYYFTNTYLPTKCNRFNQLMRSFDGKSDSFAFITDLHWHLNAGNSPALLNYIKNNTRIDKFFCGGDVCDFIDSEHQPYDAWTLFTNALKTPTYVAMGNHEYLSHTYGTEGRLYYTFNSVGRDRIGNFDRNYFYLDNPQPKIRYIFLNGFMPGTSSWTWGFEQSQLDWLTSTALSVESGWGVVIVTHMIYGINLDTYQIEIPTMSTNLLSVLDNYSGNGEIIAIICGHTHFDYVGYSTGGIPILITTCDKYIPWINGGVDKEPWLSDRAEGTTKEQAIDLYAIDRENKEITRVRVGCPIRYGIDPTSWTEYEEVTISYDRT